MCRTKSKRGICGGTYVLSTRYLVYDMNRHLRRGLQNYIYLHITGSSVTVLAFLLVAAKRSILLTSLRQASCRRTCTSISSGNICIGRGLFSSSGRNVNSAGNPARTAFSAVCVAGTD